LPVNIFINHFWEKISHEVNSEYGQTRQLFEWNLPESQQTSQIIAVLRWSFEEALPSLCVFWWLPAFFAGFQGFCEVGEKRMGTEQTKAPQGFLLLILGCCFFYLSTFFLHKYSLDCDKTG
jgi:hypothetical protein